MRLPSLTAPYLYFSITYVRLKRLLQIGILNNLPSRFPFLDHANFGDLCRTVKKMYTFLKRTCCMSYCPSRYNFCFATFEEEMLVKNVKAKSS